MQPRREPVFNLPALMIGCVAVLVAVHGARLLLPPQLDVHLIYLFGFTPARYAPPIFLLPGGLPGGFGAKLWTFLTYGFLHGSWLHLGVNVAWLVAFGTPVLRRIGGARFLLLAAVGTVAGAVAHLATNWGELVPMIGASAGISALMAAAVRFVFRRHSPFDLPGGHRPLAPLREVFRDRTALAFVLVWFAVNLVFGVTAFGAGDDAVAWQAHIGGFLAGLFLFPAFDRPSPRSGGTGAPHDEDLPPMPPDLSGDGR